MAQFLALFATFAYHLNPVPNASAYESLCRLRPRVYWAGFLFVLPKQSTSRSCLPDKSRRCQYSACRHPPHHGNHTARRVFTARGVSHLCLLHGGCLRSADTWSYGLPVAGRPTERPHPDAPTGRRQNLLLSCGQRPRTHARGPRTHFLRKRHGLFVGRHEGRL